MKQFKLTTILSAITVLALTGCAATKEANDMHKQATKNATEVFDASKAVPSAVLNGDSVKENFGYVQKNWVNPNPITKAEKDKRNNQLPEIFSKNISLTMPGRVSVVEILSEIQRSTKIKINISQDVYSENIEMARFVKEVDLKPSNQADQQSTGQSKGGAQQAGQLQGVNASAVTGAQSLNNKTTEAANAVMVDDFVFRGTLKEALELLSVKANIYWNYNDAAININRYETKTYNISALAGATSISASSIAGIAGAATTNNTTTTRNATLNTWGEIKPFLTNMLSPRGVLTVVESSGVVNVRDTIDVQKRIEKSIKDLNALMTKQVYLNVKIYSVAKNASDDYGLDLSVSWNALKSLAGPNSPTFGYKNLSGAGTNSQFSAGVSGGPFANSSLVLQALSTLGKASLVNEFNVSTLNGQAAPINNTKVTKYVSAVNSQTTAATATTAAVTTYTVNTDVVNEGINMNIIPKVEANGNILLEYMMVLNALEKMDKYTDPNSNTISLPVTTVKNIIQRASLRSGETLVLNGFKQTLSTNTDSGVGSPSNVLTGGNHQANAQEQYLVITVTPYAAEDDGQ